MDPLKPVDVGGEPNFQDMDFHPTVQHGEAIDTNHLRKVVSHPNEADVALQNLHDAGDR